MTSIFIKGKTMRNLALVFVIALVVAACGGGEEAPGSAEVKEKRTELEKLRKDREELDAKIAKLEGELEKYDTTKKLHMEVAVQPLTPVIFKTYIEVQGNVDADQSVSLSSEMPGTITKIHVKAGDQVTRGQVLAETDPRAIQQQMADLQTGLDLAKQVYEKQKGLWDQKIGTEIQYLQAKNTKESLENKMSLLQEQLRMSRIMSPIDGTVDNVDIKIGQAVAPGMRAISVVNFSNLKVKADVAESYSARVKNGSEAIVLFPDMQDTIVSTVSYASRSIDQLSRTFNVEIPLEAGKEFRPNMVTRVRINDYKSTQPELVVPVRFIQKGTEDKYVMIVEKGKVVRRKIVTGREYNGNAIITSGLAAGDMLVTEGYDLVTEGQEVEIRK